MQTPVQLEALRRRLGDLVKRKHGDLSPSSVRAVSKKARVHYTSLARFLLYPVDKRTSSLRASTLAAVAVALDANPQWVRDGQGQKQLALWPILLPTAAEAVVSDPAEHVKLVLEQVTTLPRMVQVRACRAAVSAMLDVVAQEGQTLDDQAYRCLMRLDAIRRSSARQVG
jgi:hypothetical protein